MGEAKSQKNGKTTSAVRPAGIVTAAQDRMHQLASKPELIIPGHDPAVFDRFPKVRDGVVRID